MNDFNIQAASIMSGVSVHQIRAWEKRYKAVTPRRLGNNFRSYSQENIERLKLLGLLTRHGIAISKIASYNTEELRAQLEAISHSELSLENAEPEPELKEKLELLQNFIRVKRFDLAKYEVLKFRSMASLSYVLVPLLKELIETGADQNDRKELVHTIVVGIEKITRSH